MPSLRGNPVLPSQETLEQVRSKILDHIPDQGLGHDQTKQHVEQDLVPGFNGAAQSPHYYGFVTGGSLPISRLADNLVTEYDNSCQVHLPNETAVTNIEDAATRMLCELLDLEPDQWPHRTFTTGATGSNIMGLACGREYVVAETARRNGTEASISEDGIVEAMRLASIDRVQILTTVPHSSLRKASSIVGLGRASVIDVGQKGAKHRFDMSTLQAALETPRTASIIAVSCAEVNTGLFATTGPEMVALRDLADKHGAWIHVDAAFGLLARVLPAAKQYAMIRAGVARMELADSITGDAHKLLNVPYDCGFFFSKHLPLGIEVFQNPNAAYLNTANSESTSSSDRVIPSPLNIRLENSCRFRAFPVYAALAAYGRDGYTDMLERQIKLSRAIATFIAESEAYELLPERGSDVSLATALERTFMIVIFRTRDEELNKALVQRINSTRRIYVSGTQWEGKPAARFAVANWQVDPEVDIELIKEVLQEVARL